MKKVKPRKISFPGLYNQGIVLFSHKIALAVSSPLASLTSEFGMGSGGSWPLSTPQSVIKRSRLKLNWKLHIFFGTCQQKTRATSSECLIWAQMTSNILEKWNQDSQVISTGQLNTLLCLHLQPINVVVYDDLLGTEVQRELILRKVSHLDAFSGYLIRT